MLNAPGCSKRKQKLSKARVPITESIFTRIPLYIVTLTKFSWGFLKERQTGKCRKTKDDKKGKAKE